MRKDVESPTHQTSKPAGGTPPSEMSRRDAVQVLAYMPFAAILSWPAVEHERVRSLVDTALKSAAQGVQYVPRFFTAPEFRAARILADMIIPRDEKSGNSSDAGVPEFMDFMMMDRPNDQTWMRPGLAWLDAQSNTRFGKPFADATDTEREQILDDIAWPARAPASMAAGVEFFNRFRDLTSSGFWSSRIGVKDLQYEGNTFAPDWDGCPPAALTKLGVNYDKFDRSALRLTPE
ncbi:MAG TPA: gluconate 2-dehydrogenase subunit 3 family protein [Gemmatimonadaceae bacterium]|nr:gluconate 2-dehydrogenase subunit 3 family protein [Gemmatimonadaceae bacterium]